MSPARQKPRRARRSRPGEILRRLRPGEAIAAGSAIGLLVVSFVDWYGSEVSGQAARIKLGGGAGAGGSAWQSLDVLPWFLLLASLVALGAAALALRGSHWRPAIPTSAAVAVLGGLATLWVLLRILFPPDFGDLGGVPVNASVELGAWLGLAAAAGVAYGGYRAMGERGTSFSDVADRLSPPRERPASRRRSPSSSG